MWSKKTLAWMSLLVVVVSFACALGNNQPKIEAFETLGFVQRDGKLAFVNLLVVPDWDLIRDLKISNQREYAAVVQYLLHRDSRILQEVHPKMPTELVFGPVEPREGAHITDLSARSAKKRCWCMSPCNGAGSYCYIWLANHVPAELKVLAR